uniref:Uncharacterized protein n=1 Tax=Timema bartmani TaxID=61472 RepID=A0A7R9EY44_9NEOP|nr:unnamed protein product [Timema bartmani]
MVRSGFGSQSGVVRGEERERVPPVLEKPVIVVSRLFGRKCRTGLSGSRLRIYPLCLIFHPLVVFRVSGNISAVFTTKEKGEKWDELMSGRNRVFISISVGRTGTVTFNNLNNVYDVQHGWLSKRSKYPNLVDP